MGVTATDRFRAAPRPAVITAVVLAALVAPVVLLLTGIVFVTGVLRSWFSPEKTRAILAGNRQIWGYPLAAALGVLNQIS